MHLMIVEAEAFECHYFLKLALNPVDVKLVVREILRLLIQIDEA